MTSRTAPPQHEHNPPSGLPTVEARMADLARGFPSAKKATGLVPWSATSFDGWACRTAASHGELVTARFLLAVWGRTASGGAGGSS